MAVAAWARMRQVRRRPGRGIRLAVGIFWSTKYMIKMMVLFKSGFGKGAERAALMATSPHFAPRSFAAILETMT
jgi:hypothetical protein